MANGFHMPSDTLACGNFMALEEPMACLRMKWLENN